MSIFVDVVAGADSAVGGSFARMHRGGEGAAVTWGSCGPCKGQ